MLQGGHRPGALPVPVRDRHPLRALGRAPFLGRLALVVRGLFSRPRALVVRGLFSRLLAAVVRGLVVVRVAVLGRRLSEGRAALLKRPKVAIVVRFVHLLLPGALAP